MKLIINHSSMQPIYEQIVEQIKGKIMQGELKEDTALPSVRSLAKELKVSALTVKKAYDALTEEGFIITIHGKGSFVAFANQNVMLEEKRKEVETDLEMAIRKGSKKTVQRFYVGLFSSSEGGMYYWIDRSQRSREEYNL